MKPQNKNDSILYQHDKRQKKRQSPSCLQKVSSIMANALETAFFRIGCLVGAYPIPTIIVSLAFAGVFAGGLAFFYQETQPGNLWVPSNSLAQIHKKWIDNNYPADFLRFQFILIEAENVLEPNVVKAMLTLDKKIKAISVDSGYNWENLCARLGSSCWSRSILELWSFNDTIISTLNSTSEVRAVINNTTRSPVYFAEFDTTKFLGGIEKDSNGQIISAKAALMQYVLKSNDSLANEDKPGNAVARDWEKIFIDIVAKGLQDVKKVYYNAQRSNSDEGSQAIFGDINLLFVGFVLIIAFVALALGKLNCVHQRVFLAISGVMCVGFSILLSIGLSSYAGIFFGPLHNILPFLLLGVGVDDMFVIVQAWDMIKTESANRPMSERIGLMLKQAGVSITVTSATDIVAFGIGATTVIPALRSFCIYACIGIIGIYLFSATFFVACVTLDNRRAGVYRNACCCCYKHKDYKPNRFSRREFVQTFFEYYFGPFLTRIPVKIVVLLIAAGLLAPGIYGVINLKQDFDEDWFIPDGTYLKEYINANDKFFPGDGQPGYLYIGDINYAANFTRLIQLHHDMEAQSKINTGSVLSWYYFYYQWLQNSNNALVLAKTAVTGLERLPRTDEDFHSLLQIYLSGPGARFARDIVFTESKTNSSTAAHIRISKVAYTHVKMNSASEEIDAMDAIRKLVEDVGIQIMYAHSRFYLIWEGNKVIQVELFRNIGLAFLCVVVMTLILIAHPWTCILVSSCIIATLVDVGGLIYFWGLTIDTVTSINLILAVGLAVDYAAHIGHMFMTLKGSRNERTSGTMAKMGPAVFYGGFSTFLAFVLLAGSTSYVFRVFFRVFFGVVLFGLFHGLVYLPVILSLVGPAPYLSTAELQTQEEEHVPEPVEVPPQMPVNGSIKGMNNPGFDPPQGDMYAKVKKRPKADQPVDGVREDDSKEIWSWEDDTQKQQHQQQYQSNTLPVRGNWSQQQNPYPNWNMQWAQYPAYYTLGARPPQMAVPPYQGMNPTLNNPNSPNVRKGKKSKNSQKENGIPLQQTPQNVTGYNYYGAPQYGYPQPGIQNMYPPDRFYR